MITKKLIKTTNFIYIWVWSINSEVSQLEDKSCASLWWFHGRYFYISWQKAVGWIVCGLVGIIMFSVNFTCDFATNFALVFFVKVGQIVLTIFWLWKLWPNRASRTPCPPTGVLCFVSTKQGLAIKYNTYWWTKLSPVTCC